VSVRPVSFSAAGVHVLHEEGGHEGDVAWADLGFNAAQRTATIACPVCPSVSTWPVGGGADPEMGQRLFVHLVKRRQNKTWLQSLAIAKALCDADEGPERWRLKGATEDLT